MLISMTTIRDFDQTCSVCGNTSPQPVLMSTNTWGYPDLDLRPSEMQRSTMNIWVLECPHCGYVSGNLENKTLISEKFLKSDSYMTCDGIEFIGRISKKFYKAYLIAKEVEEANKCFFNLLHCAWDCDDHEDPNAAKIRKLALKYFDDLEFSDEEKKDYLAIKADLLRRTGQFDLLIEEFSDVTIGEEIYDKIIRFQIEKANEKDTQCYTVEDAVNK